MLAWERRHNANELCYPVRHDGFNNSGTVVTVCCFLLNTDTGAQDKTLLLNTSNGSDEFCLEQNICTGPVLAECFPLNTLDDLELNTEFCLQENATS